MGFHSNNNATAVGRAAERVKRGRVTAREGCTALQLGDLPSPVLGLQLGPALNM